MRYALLLLMLALLAAGGTAMSRRELANAPVPAGQGSPVASCAAAGCHGGSEVGHVGSEQSTWAAGDPHAKAYSVLFNETSQRIMANLRKSDPKRPAAAFQDESCMACHAPNHAARSDGVGCDSCHGESQKWIARHYERGWKTTSESEKQSLGFRDTKNLVSRITACTSCHVGDGNRDVNHDLLAAGHPRLAFEYTRFHFQPGYKQHWVEKLPRRDFEIRTWFIGHAAALRSALNQSVERHQPAKATELSEQSCFACHHELSKDKRPESNLPVWNPWYRTCLELFADMTPMAFPGLAEPSYLSKVDQLSRAMADKGRDENSNENRKERQRNAQEAVDALDKYLAMLQHYEIANPGSTISDIDVRKMALMIAESAGKAPADWDALAPHYLALAAFYHADGKTLAVIREPLEALQALVKYKEGFSSPELANLPKMRGQFDKIAKILTPGAAP